MPASAPKPARCLFRSHRFPQASPALVGRRYITERSTRRWAEWVRNLKLIASGEGNVVAANNMFDVHYIKYHTGLDAVYLPSWCEAPEGVTCAPRIHLVLSPRADHTRFKS